MIKSFTLHFNPLIPAPKHDLMHSLSLPVIALKFNFRVKCHD